MSYMFGSEDFKHTVKKISFDIELKTGILSQKPLYCRKPTAGLGPATTGLQNRCSKDAKPVNTKTYKISKNRFHRSFTKKTQKHPELEQIIAAWPSLPKHIKAAIKALIQTHNK